ncbi:MAG TPA: hypothetical protein VKU86_08230 [Acidimicrobiales bacterium]|nr:hypothetical protein [Acidimicrobiales bacterium]
MGRVAGLLDRIATGARAPRAGLPPLFERISSRGREPSFWEASRWANPSCLALHVEDVQACAKPNSGVRYGPIEKLVVEARGERHIDVLPAFCARICCPVIGDFNVAWDESPVTTAHSAFWKASSGTRSTARTAARLVAP